MRPIFLPGFLPAAVLHGAFDAIDSSAPWSVVDGAPRAECVMALPGAPQTYSYGNDNRRRTRVYRAVRMIDPVSRLMHRLNRAAVAGGARYNVCVLNRYDNEHNHLGWHADDSPEQDPAHPIAVLAFGATRELWVRARGATGKVPPEDRFAMIPGALFVMPAGFQEVMLHRIPKHDRPCGPRVSLTFRKLDHEVATTEATP